MLTRTIGGVAAARRRNQAAVLFADDFGTLSLRNARPSGANKIRNSALFQAAVGTPGLEAENMAVYAVQGLSSAVAGVGTVSPTGTAIRSMDIRFFGTAAEADNHYVVFESPAEDARAPDPLYTTQSGIPVAPGETWIFSAWLRMVSAAPVGYGGTIVAVEVYDAALNWLDATFTGVTVTSTLTRFPTNPLTIPAGGRWLKVTLLVGAGQGAVDFTLRVAGPDCRQGTAAGTHVVTTSDSGTWNTRTLRGPAVAERGQEQHYADTAARGTIVSGADPFSVAAGVLSVTGTVRTGGLATEGFVSGVLTTRGRFSFLYGYAEAVMRFPPGQGVWPMFRLLPQAQTDPDDAAEIVVAEWPGGTDATLYARTRTGAAPGTVTTRTRATTVETMTDAMHSYGVLWTATTIQFYFDRVAFGTAVTTPDDLKRNLYPSLALALGGDFPGAVVGTDQFPAALQVDSVSVWDALPF